MKDLGLKTLCSCNSFYATLNNPYPYIWLNQQCSSEPLLNHSFIYVKGTVVCLSKCSQKNALVPSKCRVLLMSSHVFCDWTFPGHICCSLHNVSLIPRLSPLRRRIAWERGYQIKKSYVFLWRRPSNSGYPPSRKGMSTLSSLPRTQPPVVLWISLAMTC